MRKKTPTNTNIRNDILEAIDRAFPGKIVEDTRDPDEEDYLCELYPRLQGELSRINGAAILYERDPSGLTGESGEFDWGEVADGEHEDPPESDHWSSYHLLFLGLTDKSFRYGCDGSLMDENGEEQDVEGQGHIGCCVAVSLLAPFAIVKLSFLEEYEDGSYNYPDIEPSVFNPDMTPRDMDEHFREMFDDEGVQALHSLRDKAIQIIQTHPITVLPEEELRKPVPWLRAGDETFVGKEILGREITVQDAFFHRGL